MVAQLSVLTVFVGVTRDIKEYSFASNHIMNLEPEWEGSLARVSQNIKTLERGQIDEIFDAPKHPYTKKLMKCIPRVDDKQKRLDAIEGYVPYLTELPKGCRFSNRCELANEKCREQVPGLLEIEKGHWSRCWLNNK